jgi:hypothetical protein
MAAIYIFPASAFIFFGLQFLVSRTWKWRVCWLLNALALVILVSWFFCALDRLPSQSLLDTGFVLVFLFALPFLLGTILATILQLCTAALFRKIVQK